MGSTKIFVIQLRKVFKAAIYVVIGLALIALLAYFFMPSSERNAIEPSVQRESEIESASAYVPGTYAIELLLTNAPINLEVEVTENEIIAVRFAELSENHRALYPLLYSAMAHLSSEVLRTQSPEIALSSDYEVTSRVLLEAVKVALETAQASNE